MRLQWSYLNGIKDELDTVKSNEEFYERLDAIVLKLSKLCQNGAVKDQKSADVMTSLIFLIREGYDKGFNMVVRCEMKSVGKGALMNAYMSYMQTDIGRVYSFYTTKDKAQKAVGDDKWAEMPVQFVINNLFNRKEAVAFTFNGEYGRREETIVVPLMMLWPVFQGRMPKPENFRKSKK